LRTILIFRNAFISLTFLTTLPAPVAGQEADSLAAARRLTAAISLAAREYAIGVAPGGGRIVTPEEVAEAKLFLEQARFDVPLLPAGLHPYADSALAELRGMLDRLAPAGAVEALAASLSARIAASVGGAVIPTPSRPPSVARGAEVYRVQCAFCHGNAGAGDGPKAGSLTGPPPTDLADRELVGSLSPVDIYRRITIGVAGTAMPEFEPTLSEDDRWAVTAYVATLPYGGSPSGAVFAAVRRQLDSAVTQRSDRIALDAYLTFEQVETRVRVRDAGLAARLENEFGQLRQLAATGADTPLRDVARELLVDLELAERMITDQGSRANLLLSSFMLLVREGFEAILIIAALMTFLTKAGAPQRRRDVAGGAWAAVGASVVTAVLFEMLLGNQGGGQRAAFEGFTMLAATLVLFYVSYWLLSKIEADKWNRFLKSRMQAALTTGSALALASVAFLAVYREGVETILFYQALLVSGGAGGAGPVAAGVALGAVALVGVYILVMRLGMRIAMKPFFAVTGVLLYYMAFVFAGKGIAELQEARIVGTTVIASLAWLRVPFLGIYPTLQSLALQGVLVLCAVVALAQLLGRSGGRTGGRYSGGQAVDTAAEAQLEPTNFKQTS
jgi:high-affinity iron transporter